MLVQNGVHTQRTSCVNILVIIILYIIFSFLIQLHRTDKDHTGQATRAGGRCERKLFNCYLYDSEGSL
jgi:hypothetical protein